MKKSLENGGVVRRVYSGDASICYYLIKSFTPSGAALSIFASSPDSAAFFFDIPNADTVIDMIARGGVRPEYLEDVLEEL